MKKNKKNNDLSSCDDTESTISDSSDSINKKDPDFKIENPQIFFNQKELCHYKNIDKFFKECNEKNPENIAKMIQIIEGKSDISLRILDWFVTKYSKKKVNCNGTIKNIDAFDVKISYKAQLKAYKKRYFDPFRRRKKFYYPCSDDGFITINNENKHIYTTLGQLNFFRWAFINRIISYVEENLSFIISEMNIYNKDEKKKKQQLLVKDDSVKKTKKENEVVNNNANNDNVQNITKDDNKQKNINQNKNVNPMKFILTFD